VELRRTLLLLLVLATLGLAAYLVRREWARRAAVSEAVVVLESIEARPPSPAFRLPHDTTVFAEAAARAWAFVESHYEPATGLVRTVPDYPVATIWDIGSVLAAFFSARELGMIDRADYDARMGRLLGTLERLQLFEEAAFNKTYGTPSGRILERNDSPSVRGFGWSVTDLGRLLVWLRIIAERDPAHRPEAERIVGRLDMSRLVRDGYLWGEELDRRGRIRSFAEGFIGYEQYAAQGFALWDRPAERALSLTANSEPLRLWGEVVLVDRRPRSCLTSEPFVLAGLEYGWSPAMTRLALAVLGVQEARHRRTGRITIASEDASTVPPHHFYYYCIHGDGGPFSVAAQGGNPVGQGPATVSAKATFAWYALAPGAYTARALQAVVGGWPEDGRLIAGLDESTGTAVGPPNINTAAVILEAALYLRRGRPILDLPVPAAGSR
jgi:hypothetical protein